MIRRMRIGKTGTPITCEGRRQRSQQRLLTSTIHHHSNRMQEHLETLTTSVNQLREGHVHTKQGRSTCLKALKRSIEGRHKYWDLAIEHNEAIASYVDEVTPHQQLSEVPSAS